MTAPDDEEPTPASRRRARRQVPRRWPRWPVVLLLAGLILANEDGTAGALGTAALAQGIGLAVAVIWMAAGHNPLSRR